MGQKIKVPDQKDGEVIIRRGAEPERVFPVKGGVVEVEDENVDIFLRAVPGSEIQAGSPSPQKEAQQ